jgi:polyisoprenoid-binding protein YceI
MKKFFTNGLMVLILSSTLVSATELIIDSSHSEVGFSIKHLMISNVKGKFTQYDGELEFDFDKKTFTKFDATVVATSVDTGIEKRDDHLRSADFFDVKKYPNITFKMDKYEADGDEGVLVGDLTIHGITKKVKLNVEVNGIIKHQGALRAGFTITGKINRKDFGLKWNKMLEAGGLAVGDKVKILIELETMEL